MGVADTQYFNRLVSILKGFYYNGAYYNYFAHPYNMTWMNERCVEMPIMGRILGVHRGRFVLEVGNVLGHYMHVGHVVVDKYEVDPGILTMDILNYKPAVGYDLILCISTLEHIGKDDEQRPVKALAALDHMKTLLSPGGCLVVSVPLGYNRLVDGLLEREFDRACYIQRWGRLDWRQITSDQLPHCPVYDNNLGANIVAFGYYQRGYGRGVA